MVEETYNTQRVDPVGLAVLLVATILILSPRRLYVYMGLVMIIAFLPGGQRIVIASLDFFFIRIDRSITLGGRDENPVLLHVGQRDLVPV